MTTHSHNDKVIIYPTESGWKKIKALLSNSYLLSSDEADKRIEAHTTKEGGYTDYLWLIIHDLHDMFYHGQSYFKNTNITFFNP
jgi:hypothetical protein